MLSISITQNASKSYMYTKIMYIADVKWLCWDAQHFDRSTKFWSMVMYLKMYQILIIIWTHTQTHTRTSYRKMFTNLFGACYLSRFICR